MSRQSPCLPTRRDVARAFREIEAATGLMLREDFLCCSSCARDRLDREAAEASRPSQYGFYHAQDTEAAAATGVLYIGFQGEDFPDDPDLPNTAEIGRLLQREFVRRGWFVQWDRSPHTRIAVAVSGPSFQRLEVETVVMECDFEESPVPGSEGWYVMVWHEPEAALADRRWCALLATPYDSGEAAYHAPTREEVLAAATEGYPAALDNLLNEVLRITAAEAGEA